MSTIKGDELRSRMRATAIREDDWANKLDISQETLKDYLRPSRVTSKEIIEKLQELESRLGERLQAARDALRLSYSKVVGTTRNLPGSNLPRLSPEDVRPFIRLCIAQTLPDNGETISYEAWRNTVLDRFVASDKRVYSGGSVVLIGSPGIGKTTCLRAFVTDVEVFKRITPLIFPLHQIHAETSVKSLQKLVVDHIKEHHWSQELPDFEAFVELECKEKKLVYVFDGLDEIASVSVRQKVVSLAQQLQRPFLLTSRPTRPHLVSSHIAALPFKVVGFDADQIIKYLDFLSARCADEGREKEKKDIEDFNRLLQKKRQQHENIRRKQSILEELQSRKSEPGILKLLSSPAVLNIAVSMAGRLGENSPANSHYLLDAYHDFVAERGSEFRSIAPQGIERVIDRGDFIRILAAVAWLGYYRAEGAGSIDLPQLQNAIEDWASQQGGFQNPKAAVKAALQGAVDCNLIDADQFERGRIRFSLSHEHLLSYYAGRFIEIVTNSMEMPFRYLKSRRTPIWADAARFSYILETPTLGAAQGAMFQFCCRTATSEVIDARRVQEVVEALFASPRIPPEDTNLPEADAVSMIERILPGHRIMVWKLLESPEFKVHRQRNRTSEIYTELCEWLPKQYNLTPFEHVFEAILANCYDLVIRPNGLSVFEENHWRLAPNFNILMQGIVERKLLVKLESQLSSTGNETEKAFQDNVRELRRCVYMMRYFENDRSEKTQYNKMVHWLHELDSIIMRAGNEERKSSAGIIQKMSRSTLALFVGAGPAQIDDGSINDWVEQHIKANAKTARLIRRQTWRLENATTPQDFLDIYCSQVQLDLSVNDLDDFHAAIMNSNRDDLWFLSLAKLIRDRMLKCQEQTCNIESSPSPEVVAEEARLCHLILGLSGNHYFRMLFLPPHYSLAKIGVPEVAREYFDNEGRFLKLLFRGASQPLLPKGDERVNLTRFSHAEFMLYDYYARAIWGLLGDDPRTILAL